MQGVLKSRLLGFLYMIKPAGLNSKNISVSCKKKKIQKGEHLIILANDIIW